MVGAARGEPSGCIGLCGVSKTFEDLYAQLVQIAETRPEGSGTLARLDEGVHAIGKKIVEEAAEVWMASGVPEHRGGGRGDEPTPSTT